MTLCFVRFQLIFAHDLCIVNQKDFGRRIRMYLRRKVDAFLEAWKADQKRKPLIIKGSRQIGKTESILHFAARNYENVIEINFVRDEKYKGIIGDGYETADIIKNISLIDPSKRFVPGKTLIFFDEITAFPEIVASLKFFCIDGRFDVICSGSMLGVNYCKVYAEKLCMPLWTGAVCIPRAIFDETGGFKSHLKLGEDFDVWIRIALKHKVVFLNKPLSNYNQDVDVAQRGIGRLRDPKTHMLWNLDYLVDEERTNPDYKQLIDNLRTYSLMPYYLSKTYQAAAKQELAKVDWSKQPSRIYKEYQRPVWFLKTKRRFMKFGSKVKQWLIKNFSQEFEN